MESVKFGQADGAHIGKSVLIKGELSGSEDLYVDGEVEGRIELGAHNLAIGPNGRVHANVQARDVTIHGKVQGNIIAGERVELKSSASVVGDIVTGRIIVEEGAFFKGSIDIQRESASRAAEPRPAATAAAATPAQASLISK
ncbi:MAG: polymer-forming cytoskeletal protein [Acidobacteria bacterium]|nr:polymer-forming cytoskeletal protein [Acidobacteriota bacterium]